MSIKALRFEIELLSDKHLLLELKGDSARMLLEELARLEYPLELREFYARGKEYAREADRRAGPRLRVRDNQSRPPRKPRG